jgi:hypothetical protein
LESSPLAAVRALRVKRPAGLRVFAAPAVLATRVQSAAQGWPLVGCCATLPRHPPAVPAAGGAPEAAGPLSARQ